MMTEPTPPAETRLPLYHMPKTNQISQDRKSQSTYPTTTMEYPASSTKTESSLAEHVLFKHRQTSGANYHELRTTFDGELGAPGVMFDVRSTLSAIRIAYFGFHTRDIVPECEITVYTKLGTHRSFETMPSMWTMVAQGKTQCSGTDTLTEISSSMFNSEVIDATRVQKGETRAFYITSTTPLRYTKTFNEGGVHVYDKYVQILEGTGLVGFYKDLFSPRMWNGIVGYYVEDHSAPQYGSNHKFGEVYDGDGCAKELQVSFEDNTGSYGYMFDVQSYLEPVTIYGLEFHTDRTYDLHYEIYTLKDGFQYGTSGINLWTLIARGTVKGAGHGKGTAVRDEDFASVDLEPGSTQGFYITLDSEDLRYRNSKSDVGSVFIKNDHIAVTVGAGVGEFPLANNFYYPRVWNGRVLYRTATTCPSEDTTDERDPVPSTSVRYNYVVRYPDDWTDDAFYKEISETTEVALLKIIESDSELKLFQRFDNLELKSVKASEDIRSDMSSACYPPKKTYSCEAVVIDAVVTHDSGIDVDSVTYGLLRNAPMISERLNAGSMIIDYFGDVALETKKVFSFNGVPDRLMDTSEIDYFRRVTKSFLTFTVADGIDILTVEVETQGKGFGDYKNGRNLQGSSLDVSTIITGKHRPPPEIIFDDVVEDSINANSDEFGRDLTGGGAHLGGDYFTDVKEVIVQPVQESLDHSPPTQSPSNSISLHDKEGGLNIATSIGIVVGVALFTFGLVFGAFVFRKRVREKRTKRKQAQIIGNIDIDEDDPLFVDLNKYEASVHVDGMIDKDILIESATSKTGETSKLSSVNSKSHRIPESYHLPKRLPMEHVSNIPNASTMDDGNRPGLGPRNYGPPLIVSQKEDREAPHILSKKSLRTNEFGGEHHNTQHQRARSISRGGSKRSLHSKYTEYSKLSHVDKSEPSSPRRKVNSARDFEDEYENRIRQKHYGEALERLQCVHSSDRQTPTHQEPSNIDNTVRRRQDHRKDLDYDNSEYPRRSSPYGRHISDSLIRDVESKPFEIGFERKMDHDHHEPSHGDNANQGISQVDEQVSVAEISTTSTISTKSGHTAPKKMTSQNVKG